MHISTKVQVSERFQKQIKNFLHIAVVIASCLFHVSSSHSMSEIRNLHYIAEKVHGQSEFKSSLLFNSSEILEKLPEVSWPQFL